MKKDAKIQKEISLSNPPQIYHFKSKKSEKMEGKNFSQKEKKLIVIWKNFLIEGILFSSIVILGILTALRIINLRAKYQLPPRGNFAQSPAHFGHFLFIFFLVTLFVFSIPFIFKKRKAKAVVFKLIFLLGVFLGGVVTLGVWLGDLSFLIMALFVLIWLKWPLPLIHNLILILALCGAGALLGLGFHPKMIAIFLVLFSIYDFIAVYKTKHMIQMAKEMASVGAIMGFLFPQKSFKDFLLPTKKIELGGKYLVLGTGDVVFPLIFIVSLLPESFFGALLLAFFSFLGILASFAIFLFKKEKKPMPALPPIAFFSLLGYLIYQILNEAKIF